MNYRKSILYITTAIALLACGNGEKSDAYGNFEATTVTISAKGNGVLTEFLIQEGKAVKKGDVVGLIDTTQLHLEKLQVKAQLMALVLKTKDATPDIEVLEERKTILQREKNRTESLLKADAAPQKQWDDFDGEIKLIDQQIFSLKRNTEITNRGILAEREPLQAQLQIIENRIRDHQLLNPIDGTILTKLVEPNEFVSTGRGLYRVADLKVMKLRAYTTAELLRDVSLNDEVMVLVDEDNNSYKELEGRITWIASEAEFTPENIQTKEDRVGLVYAIDILVENDGYLRIGMPGEVVFKKKGN
ncbi:MAG: HlyD family secretion protein [Balneola sp.]